MGTVDLEFVMIEGKKKIVTTEALVMKKAPYNLVNMDALVDEHKIGSWQGPDGTFEFGASRRPRYG